MPAPTEAGSGAQFATDGGYGVTGSLTTYTVTSDADSVLFVCAGWSGDPGAISAAQWDSGGTPQNLTLVQSYSSGSAFMNVYRLIAPTTGNKTLTLSWANSIGWCLGVIQMKDAHQTTPVETADTITATGTSTTPATGNVSSASGDTTMGFAVERDAATGNTTFTACTQTEGWLHNTTVGNEPASGCSYNTSGSAADHSFTISASKLWVAVGIHVKAAGGGGGGGSALQESEWLTLEPQTNPSVISVW